MTTDHILQSCPMHAAARARVWTTPTMLETKLYGTLEDLRGTATYIRDTELDI
jgi:hypothetical protein